MAISETKMQMVIANYFKDECDVNTSIRQAFEKGFRIGVKKGASTNRPQGKWMHDDSSPIAYRCTACNTLQHWSVIQNGRYRFCPNCGCRMKGADDE